MALLSVNAAKGTEGHRPAGTRTLGQALGALPLGQPVTTLIHGFRFCPSDPAHDPHRHILSLSPRPDCWKAVSWPRHLHLDRPGRGLGIGFGWPAMGALPQVAKRAFEAGQDLARMIDTIHCLRPDAPVQIVAHSLGARVALTALAAAPPGALRRMILIAGAEYREAAELALSQPAAARTQVLNVVSGENRVFDLLFRFVVNPERRFDRPLSAGLGHLVGCTDLAIDDPATRAALCNIGHRLRPPTTRVCHWSGYMRPGLFGIYRHVLDQTDPYFPAELANALAPRAHADGERGRTFPRHIHRLSIAGWTARSQM